MTLLLDTHTLLWFLTNDASLSARARQSIEDPANAKQVSAASLWEAAIKAGLGKLNLRQRPDIATELPGHHDLARRHLQVAEYLVWTSAAPGAGVRLRRRGRILEGAETRGDEKHVS